MRRGGPSWRNNNAHLQHALHVSIKRVRAAGPRDRQAVPHAAAQDAEGVCERERESERTREREVNVQVCALIMFARINVGTRVVGKNLFESAIMAAWPLPYCAPGNEERGLEGAGALR